MMTRAVARFSVAAIVATLLPSAGVFAQTTVDYEVTDLRFYQDPQSSGGGYALTVVVRNNGSARNQDAQVRLDIDGVRGVMTYGIRPLGTGQSDTAVWSSSVLPPRGWVPSAGTHNAVACLEDAGWNPPDTNSINNCKNLSFTMVAPRTNSSSSSSNTWSSASVSSRSTASSAAPADYSVYSAEALAVSYAVGEPVGVSAVIINRGGQPPRGTFANVAIRPLAQ